MQPGVKHRGLVSVSILMVLVFGGVSWLVGFPRSLALPQVSAGETAPSTHLVLTVPGG